MGMSKNKKAKTINVDLPADAHRALKIACAARDLTFSEAVTEAVRAWAKRATTETA